MDGIKFLGATVVNFSANLGWNDSASSFKVTLVESDGDQFVYPKPGVFVVFQAGDWYFGGMVQNYSQRIDTQGNPIFEVVIQDPRDLLDGVHLILSNYAGPVISNVFNLYGYLLSKNIFPTKSGYSGRVIKQALTELFNGASPAHGRYLNVRGLNFILNLDLLPDVPDYYRITQNNMSMMDLIRQICDDTNHSYFFDVIPGEVTILKLYTRNNNAPNTPGAITQFLSQTLGETRYAGFEFNNEYTSKILFGGRKAHLFFQYANGGSDGDVETDPWENSIWPYWGLNPDKSAVIGHGIWDDHTFTIDISFLGIGAFGNFYPTDIGELRAALESYDCWSTYLVLRDGNEYKIRGNGKREAHFRSSIPPFPRLFKLGFINDDGTIEPVDNMVFEEGSEYYEKASKKIAEDSDVYTLMPLTYKHDGEVNVHFAKASRLKMSSFITMRHFGAALYTSATVDKDGKPIDIDVNQFKATENHAQNAFLNDIIRNEIDTNIIQQLYSFIRGYADEYYGKKFMVRVPFIVSNRDETNEVFTSYETTDLGYLNEEDYPIAWQNNLIPVPYSNGYLSDPRLMSEDGRIYCYVRFDGISNLDYSDIPEDSVIVSTMFNSVFIKCEVSPNLVYQNYGLLYSPRAVVTLPGRVTSNDNYYYGYRSFDIISDFLYHADKPQVDILNQAGADAFNLWLTKYAVTPNLAAIPLLSNERYGPWYSEGLGGKVNYEEDDTLVPWNFPNWDYFLDCAKSKVLNSVSYNDVNEYGSITFPGLPNVLLGHALVAGGPAVTNIAIDVGDSIKTTYTMNSWPVHPYKLSEQKNDFISRIHKRQQDLKKNIYEHAQRTSSSKVNNLKLLKTIADMKRSAAHGNHSSHDVLVGEKHGDKYNMVLQPCYNTMTQIKDGDTQAIMGLNSLLFPFSFVSGSLPYYHKSDHDDWSSSYLNPFKPGTYHHIVSNEYGLKIDDINTPENIKAIALRTPMVLTGWGYGVDGLPVPSSGVTEEQLQGLTDKEKQELIKKAKATFHQDHLQPHMWNTGPLDLRWDKHRNVWTSTSDDKFVQIVDKFDGEIEYEKMPGVNFLGEDRYWPRGGTSEFKPHIAFSGGYIYYCREWSLEYESDRIGARVILNPTDNYLLCGTYKLVDLEPSGIWFTKYVNGKYIIDQPATFWDHTFRK